MRKRPEKRELVQVATSDLAALNRRIEELETENVALRQLTTKSGTLASRHSLILADQLLTARRALRQQSRVESLSRQAWDRVKDHLFDLERLLPQLADPAQASILAHRAALRQLVAEAERETAEGGFIRVAEMSTQRHTDSHTAKEMSMKAVHDFSLRVGAVLEDDGVPAEVREAFYTLLDFALQLCEKIDKVDKARFRARLQPLLSEHLARLGDKAAALAVATPQRRVQMLPGPVYLRCELRNNSQPNLIGQTLAGVAQPEAKDKPNPLAQLGLLGKQISTAFDTAEELKNLLGGPGTPAATAHLLARLLQALSHSRVLFASC